MTDQKKRPPEDEWVDVPAEGSMTIGGDDEWVDVPAAPEVPKDPKSLGGFAWNALTSAGGLLKDTAKGALDIGSAITQFQSNPVKLLTQPGVLAAVQHPGATAGAIAGGAKEYLGKRYGGGQEILDTLYEDPFGVAADVSTVASLGGTAAARAPGVVGRVGRGLAVAGDLTDPLRAMGRAGIVAAPTAQRAAESLGRKLNARALKVPEHITKRNPTVDIPDVMGREGIVLSGGGQRGLRERIKGNERAVADLVAKSTATSTVAPATIPLQEMAAERRALLPGSSLHGEAPAVDEVVGRLFEANAVTPPPPPRPGPPATSVGYSPSPAPPVVAPGQGALRTPAPPPGRVSYGAPAPGAWNSAPAAPTPPGVSYGPGASVPGAPPPVAQGSLPVPAPPLQAAAPPTPHGPFLKEIDAPTFHRTKVALNQALQKSFGADVTPLQTDLLHGQRKGVMQATENLVPEVRALNQEVGPLHAVDDAVTEALKREGGGAITKRDLLTTSLGSGLGALFGGGVPGAVAGGLVGHAAQSPFLRTVAARELYRGGRNLTPIAAGLEQAGPTLTRLALLQRLGLANGTEP